MLTVLAEENAVAIERQIDGREPRVISKTRDMRASPAAARYNPSRATMIRVPSGRTCIAAILCRSNLAANREQTTYGFHPVLGT